MFQIQTGQSGQPTDGVRDAEDSLRQILDAISDAVLVKGPGSKILWANRVFREWYGMSNEELAGLIDAPFAEPNVTLRYVQDDATVFATGKALDIPEEPVTRHDGVVITCHTVKSPIFDSNGQVAMTVGVSRDITERRRLESTLRIAERMSSVGTMAAGAAHEINNPLAIVTAGLEFAKASLNAPTMEVREVCQALCESLEGVERIRLIVRGLSNLSQGGEGSPKPVDLREILESTLGMLDNEIRHRARLITEFGEVPQVMADPGRLGQVFLNLLINAAHAIPMGSAQNHEIRVSLRSEASGEVAVEIADTGCGMTPETYERIFDPFFTTKPIGSGTGLGLATCLGIVGSLRGTLSARTELGQGSVFRVVLPRAANPEPVASPSSSPSAAEPTRRRILVIDDEPLIGTLLKRQLARHHEVVVTDQATVALASIASGERFDVILCDLMMPVMTGMELHARLFETYPQQAARMIFLTGGAFAEEAVRFLRNPSIRSLQKPFTSAALAELIASCP